VRTKLSKMTQVENTLYCTEWK